MKFYVEEVTNESSHRIAEELEAANLEEAKQIAANMQNFCGTVLKIGTEVNNNGFILDPVAIKSDGKDWEEVNSFDDSFGEEYDD